MCVFHMSVEEGVRLSGAGVTGGASRPPWVLELQSCQLEEQETLLNSRTISPALN